jgi:glutaredoxin
VTALTATCGPVQRRIVPRILAALIGLVVLVGPHLGPATAAGAISGVRGAGLAADPSVTLLLFHGEGCPHCAAERAWLEQLAAAHPHLQIEQYEVWNDEANRLLLAGKAEELGFEPTGVPVTIVGDRVWIGFSESIAAEIDAVVSAASAAAPAPAQPPAAAGSSGAPLDQGDPATGPASTSQWSAPWT